MNPFHFAYASTTGIETVQPGGIVITGRGNRRHSAFQTARARGVEVFTYLMLFEVPDNLSNAEDAWQFLLPDGSRPELWPYRDANGLPRVNWAGTKLIDVRPGTPYVAHVVTRIREACQAGLWDGLFLDGHGARLYGIADWPSWSVEEQVLWTQSMVNLARLVAEECAQHSPMMKIVHNSLWNTLPTSHPAYAEGLLGEQYCNGVMIENPVGETPGAFHRNSANRTFGLLPRRVFVTERSDAQALAWVDVPGVTHVCSIEAGESYASIAPPVVPYVDEDPLRVLQAQLAQVTAQRDQALADLSAARAECVTATQALTAAQASLATAQSALAASQQEVLQLQSDLAAAVQREGAARAAQLESEQKLAAACNAWRALTALAA
jgi:hypothetical protein